MCGQNTERPNVKTDGDVQQTLSYQISELSGTAWFNSEGSLPVAHTVYPCGL
jgi:hypothetical protein